MITTIIISAIIFVLITFVLIYTFRDKTEKTYTNKDIIKLVQKFILYYWSNPTKYERIGIEERTWKLDKYIIYYSRLSNEDLIEIKHDGRYILVYSIKNNKIDWDSIFIDPTVLNKTIEEFSLIRLIKDKLP